jgi:ankyrin repeat protein
MIKKIILFILMVFLFSSFISYKERWDESRDCWSPLMVAIYKNKIKKFEKLIKNKKGITYVSICDKSDYELTPLEVAIRCENAYAVELLLKTRAYKNLDEYLLIASGHESIRTVALIIQYGGNPNYKDENNHTIIMQATSFSTIEVLKTILSFSSQNINIHRNKNSATALMLASYAKDIDKVKLLLEYKSDIKIKDNKGRTAYDYLNTDYINKNCNEQQMNELRKLLKID